MHISVARSRRQPERLVRAQPCGAGGVRGEQKEATSGAAGASERKDMCHPFPSLPSRARQESTNKECVGRKSLKFVLSNVTKRLRLAPLVLSRERICAIFSAA